MKKKKKKKKKKKIKTRRTDSLAFVKLVETWYSVDKLISTPMMELSIFNGVV